MKTKFSFKPIIMAVLCMAAAVIVPSGVKAQNTNTVWKGTKYEDITPALNGTTANSSGTTFFLYNVGTGKFIMQGGGWGTEAILYLQDYGSPCTLSINQGTNQNLTWIEAAVSTASGAHTIGCNVLNYSSGNLTGQTHNAILDAQGGGSNANFNYNNQRVNYTRSWTFEPIVDETNPDIYTYHLKETITRSGALSGSGTFYLGAVSGTNGETGDNKTAYVDTSVDGAWDKVKDSPNYQWRLVTLAQLEGVQTTSTPNEYGGLNANVSYLLKDPFFDRSQTAFNGTWIVESNAGAVTEDTKLRRDWTTEAGNSALIVRSGDTAPYTYYYYTVVPNERHYTNPGDRNGLYDAPWNDAVFRKLEPSESEWGSIPVPANITGNDAQRLYRSEYHRDWAQYEMATLEGEGIAYQNITFPVAGQYMLTARAFTNGNTKGYLYVAKDGGSDEITSKVPAGTPPVKLWHEVVDNTKSTEHTTNVDAAQDWPKVAKYIDDNSNFTTGILFNVEKGSTWRIGLKKVGAVQNTYKDIGDAVSRTASGKTQVWDFRHDTTYVAIDNMQLHYLGEQAPFAFNENKVSDDYMLSDITGSTAKKLTNRTMYLKRNAKINCWQPIILPISLTTEQLRNAFGNDVRLGELAGVGKAEAASPTSIDFKSVTLTSGGVGLQAGKFYLIYATHAPGNASWKDDKGEYSGLYYILGRHDYDPAAELGDNVVYTNTDGTTTKSIGPSPFSQEIANTKWNGTKKDWEPDPFTENNLTIHATWIRTPEDSTGNNLNYVPAGAYVVQDGEMYYLTKPGRINGFKWWITPSENSPEGAKGLTFRFIDPSNFVTYIDGVSTDRKPKSAAQRAVYNLAGVRVANDASELQNLPSGIYITGGKKIIKK